MKALKATFISALTVTILMVLVLGSYNTSVVDKSAFTRNDFGIKFAKRLDEINGEIVIGRAAASLPKLSLRSTNLIKKEVKRIMHNELAVKEQPKKRRKADATKKAAVAKNVAPVVNDDLDLSLTGGLFNKKPLDGNTEFSGSAKVVDGVVEEISVNLPDGDGFTINTQERMVGNVFQYEDTKTREMKSGLFYKVKPGVFMVTLTNDTQYPGLRLEFKTDEGVSLAENSQSPKKQTWGMNNQNRELPEVEVSNYEEDDPVAEFDYYQSAAQDNVEDDFEEGEEFSQNEAAPAEQPESFGFNFNNG